MKEYLLKLIDEDIKTQTNYLQAAIGLINIREDCRDYWLGRVKTQEKKIALATKYRTKLLNMKMI